MGMKNVLEPLPADTLLDYFRFAVASGKTELLVSKVGGSWTPLSASEFGERTQGLALGLALLGVDREDRVAILSENRPEWPMADFAALALGALTVPIYTSYLAPQVEYILRDSLAKVVFVSNAIELQKVVDVRDRCPDLKHVIVVDHVPWSSGNATPFETVVQKGLAALRADPGAFEERASAVLRGDLATMIYTSGTTGEPKGAVLTHENFVSNVSACSALFDVQSDTLALSFLPLSHVFERMSTTFTFPGPRPSRTPSRSTSSRRTSPRSSPTASPPCHAFTRRCSRVSRLPSTRLRRSGARFSPGA